MQTNAIMTVRCVPTRAAHRLILWQPSHNYNPGEYFKRKTWTETSAARVDGRLIRAPLDALF